MGAFTSETVRRHAPGCWFPLSHAEAIRRHPRLQLRALCDVDADALRRAAAVHGVAATYVDLDRLLDEVHPPLLGIATRTIGRAALIRDAIAHGVRALHLEKPLCNSTRELATIEALFAQSGVRVTYGALRRHFAPYRLALELAASGRYGALREIRVNLGSGTLFWTHPHSVDLILFAAGNRAVAGVQARLAEVSAGASRCDILSDPRVIAATIHFDDGLVGHVTQALGSDLVLSFSEGEISVRSDGAAIEIYSTPEDAIYPVSTPFDLGSAASEPAGTLAAVSQLVRALDGDAAAIAENTIIKR
ncbi:MAG: Gfo/Idh/MocA family protein, partial [Caldimonas sp.]